MNPIFRFIYWNMNYHVEHHMFPMVPYHALPKLHAVMGPDLPTPYPDTIVRLSRDHRPALLRQLKDPTTGPSSRELPALGKALSAGVRTGGAVPAPAE